MLHGIVVALCHTILDHVLPAKLITLHDVVVERRQGQGLELGLGLFFFCFYVLTSLNVHGKVYAKQVRIMCVCFPFHC